MGLRLCDVNEENHQFSPLSLCSAGENYGSLLEMWCEELSHISTHIPSKNFEDMGNKFNKLDVTRTP